MRPGLFFQVATALSGGKLEMKDKLKLAGTEVLALVMQDEGGVLPPPEAPDAATAAAASMTRPSATTVTAVTACGNLDIVSTALPSRVLRLPVLYPTHAGCYASRVPRLVRC